MKEIIINNLDSLLVDNSYGANQAWYQDRKQVMSGCGPTSATNLVKYYDIGKLWNNKADALIDMEVLWKYITPGLMGVNKAIRLEEGLIRYYTDNKVAFVNHRLEVNSKLFKRVSLLDCVSFIKNALSSNNPMAFLNRSASKVSNLSSWHWVLIVGLSYDDNNVQVLIYDEGQRKKIDFKLWYQSTILGGGLVYFSLEI